jgi:hypothetical protein
MADRNRRPSFDEAIDRAVRDMMNADARPGFERRVMERASAPAVRRFAWPRLAAASAALAMIVIALLVLRDAPERTTHPQTGPVAVTRPAQTAQVPTARPSGQSTRVIERRTERKPRAVESTAVFTAARAPEEIPIPSIAALQAPTALAVESIQPRPVNVPDIDMPTIEIGELTVEPLRPSDGREE